VVLLGSGIGERALAEVRRAAPEKQLAGQDLGGDGPARGEAFPGC
jgi:hypothetical protein